MDSDSYERDGLVIEDSSQIVSDPIITLKRVHNTSAVDDYAATFHDITKMYYRRDDHLVTEQLFGGGGGQLLWKSIRHELFPRLFDLG